MDSCWVNYHITIALNKNSIYLEDFDKRIERLREGGIIKKWVKDELDKAARLADSKAAQASLRALELADIQVPGYMIMVFLPSCLICLLLEFFVHSIGKRKIKHDDYESNANKKQITVKWY